MTTLLTHADPVQPTLATDSIEPVDVPGLPRYREVLAAIFCDPKRLDVVAAYALEAWDEAAAAGITSLAGIRRTHQRAYEAAARVLNEAWERELAELAADFVMADDPTPITEDYAVVDEPEPVVTLAARPNRALSPSERYTAETAEVYEGGTMFGGHEG